MTGKLSELQYTIHLNYTIYFSASYIGLFFLNEGIVIIAIDFRLNDSIQIMVHNEDV